MQPYDCLNIQTCISLFFLFPSLKYALTNKLSYWSALSEENNGTQGPPPPPPLRKAAYNRIVKQYLPVGTFSLLDTRATKQTINTRCIECVRIGTRHLQYPYTFCCYILYVRYCYSITYNNAITPFSLEKPRATPGGNASGEIGNRNKLVEQHP